MKPNSNKSKGDVLEQAVKLIQDAILSADPKLVGTKFSIETNKIETVGGVRHEIDVLVRTLPGSPYESSYLFECKNWSKPVGKNEVIILAAKVEALGASRGFLVARELTRDAEAQIKLDSRLRTLVCRDDFITPFNFELLHLTHAPLSIQLILKERGVPALEVPEVLDWKTIVCRLNGKIVDIQDFTREHIDDMVAHDKQENAARYRETSAHYRDVGWEVTYDPGEFSVDGRDMERVIVRVKLWVEINQKKLLSKFELSGQGRAFFFEPVADVAGRQIEITVVQRI